MHNNITSGWLVDIGPIWLAPTIFKWLYSSFKLAFSASSSRIMCSNSFRCSPSISEATWWLVMEWETMLMLLSSPALDFLEWGGWDGPRKASGSTPRSANARLSCHKDYIRGLSPKKAPSISHQLVIFSTVNVQDSNTFAREIIKDLLLLIVAPIVKCKFLYPMFKSNFTTFAHYLSAKLKDKLFHILNRIINGLIWMWSGILLENVLFRTCQLN